MSKSVLVINTPKYCALCVLRSGVLHPFCRVNNRDIADLSIRPDWCPLKPLPEKMKATGLYNCEYFKAGDRPPSYKIGWNNCIDVTSDATICIQPDKIALIELKEINGVPSLVIPVNGELKINGIEVELK